MDRGLNETAPKKAVAPLAPDEVAAAETVLALGQRALKGQLATLPEQAKEVVMPSLGIILGPGPKADTDLLQVEYANVQFRMLGLLPTGEPGADLRNEGKAARQVAQFKELVADFGNGLITIANTDKHFFYYYPDGRTTFITGRPGSDHWFEIDLNSGKCEQITGFPCRVVPASHFSRLIPDDYIVAACWYPSGEGQPLTERIAYVAHSPNSNFQVGDYQSPVKAVVGRADSAKGGRVLLVTKYSNTHPERGQLFYLDQNRSVGVIDGKQINAFIEGPIGGDSKAAIFPLPDGGVLVAAAFDDGFFMIDPVLGRRIRVCTEIPVRVSEFVSHTNGRAALIAAFVNDDKVRSSKAFEISLLPGKAAESGRAVGNGSESVDHLFFTSRGELWHQRREKHRYVIDCIDTGEILIPPNRRVSNAGSNPDVDKRRAVEKSCSISAILPSNPVDGTTRVKLWVHSSRHGGGTGRMNYFRVCEVREGKFIPLSFDGVSSKNIKIVNTNDGKVYGLLSPKQCGGRGLFVDLDTDVVTDANALGIAKLKTIVAVNGRALLLGQTEGRQTMVVDVRSGESIDPLDSIAIAYEDRPLSAFCVTPDGELLVLGRPAGYGFDAPISFDKKVVYAGRNQNLSTPRSGADGSLWLTGTEYDPLFRHQGVVVEMRTGERYTYPAELFQHPPMVHAGPNGELVVGGDAKGHADRHVYYDLVSGQQLSVPEVFYLTDSNSFVFLGGGCWAHHAKCPSSGNSGVYRGSGLMSRNRRLDAESVAPEVAPV